VPFSDINLVMQNNIDMCLQKITSFFKNKIDIFKNKLMKKTLPASPALPASPKKLYTSVVSSINNTDNNNTHSIYTTPNNTVSDNSINNTKINMQLDTIPAITTTTTTDTVTTVTTTTTTTKTVTTIHNTTNCHFFTHSIDYSKYTDNIISSLIDNMIDDIQVEHSIVNNKKDKKIIQKVYDYYDRQRKYSYLRDILTPDVFTEFEQVVNNVLCKNHAYLAQLYPLKRYPGDLSDIGIRYGVFETNNFVIKIDDECDVFIPELELMSHLGKGVISPHNIVLPYFVRIVKKNKDDTKDSSKDGTKNGNNIPVKHMHFSIQPRIKNTLSLRKWINMLSNRCFNVKYYIQMCITISKSILFMHSHNIVHGDLKPDNILIELSNNTPYIIDFGLSGLHRLSQGTGGTQPYCCPETTNCSSTKSDCYVWVKNKKQYDLWSIALIFSTIIIFKESYGYYSDYPRNYFTKDYYVNAYFLQRIPIHFREPFILVLSNKSDINLSNFITLLENSLPSVSPP